MTTNINEFLKTFKENQQITLDACSKIVNATALQMYKKIVDRTPVGNPLLWHPPKAPKDYVPGTLKASWQISFSGQQRNIQGQYSTAQQIIQGYGLSLKINDTDRNKSITISNPQPYAQAIETGWSTQAPAGMMRVTVAEYSGILNQAASQYRIR